ncbi:MAG: serine hydrolase [Bacteroidota bacterium]
MIKPFKLILPLLLLLGQLQYAGAQDATNTRIQKSFVKYYNKKQYQKIHSLFTDQFKRVMDQEQLDYFMEFVLHYEHGRIKSSRYDRMDHGFRVYLVEFEKGTAEMHLANEKNLIAGFAVKPVSKGPVINQHPSFKSSNPMISVEDSMCDKAVQAFLKRNNAVGLSIGILCKGKTYVYGYGETYKGNATVPDEHTIFDLGSVSKTFTGILLAIAVEQKLVKPDDDIRKFLSGDYPNLEYKGAPVTLLSLVNHTSGLPRVPDDLVQQPGYKEEDPYKYYSREMILANLHQIKLAAKPGTINEYSNYGISVCGIILEQLFKKTYAQLVEEYIAAPAGMQQTFVNIPDSLRHRMVGCYDEDNKAIADWSLGEMAAAGGVSSTVADMLTFLRNNMEEKSSALKLSHIPTFKMSQQQQVGYAWVTSELQNGQHLVWHNGATYGSTAFCGYIPETGTGVVILNNTGTSVDPLAIDILKTMR